jgi:hypothetical protein
MSHKLISIYSGEGGATFMKHFKGGASCEILKTSALSPPYFYNNHFSFILPFAPKSFELYLPFSPSRQHFVVGLRVYHLPIRILHLFILTMFGEKCKLWSFSLCSVDNGSKKCIRGYTGSEVWLESGAWFRMVAFVLVRLEGIWLQ